VIRRTVLVAGIATAALLSRAALAYETEWLTAETNPANRINVVFLGDWYAADELSQAKLLADAHDTLEALLATSPFRELRPALTAKLVHVTAPEYAYPLLPSPLGTHSCNNGPIGLMCVDDGKALSIAAQHFPEYTFAVAILNQASHMRTATGSVALTTASPEGRGTLVHESGHALGGLADEYDTIYPDYPECGIDCDEPNVTRQTDRSHVKWSHWIDPATPVPTPGGTPGIGVFEGARYQRTGVYRPTYASCLMRLRFPSYCSVCTEALTLSLLARMNLIDDALPAPGAVRASACAAIPFTVKPLPLERPGVSGRMAYSWSIDGVARPETSAALALAPGTISAGSHVVTAAVRYETPLVRSDPTGILEARVSWSLSVEACPTGATAAMTWSSPY
jgi:hypothetical protein